MGSGYCCIEYTPVTWDVYAGSQVSGTGPVTCVQAAAAITENCASAVTCTSNFVIIPGAQSPQYCNAAGSLCMSKETVAQSSHQMAVFLLSLLLHRQLQPVIDLLGFTIQREEKPPEMGIQVQLPLYSPHQLFQLT